MAKKNFTSDIAVGTDRFFSANDPKDTQDTKDTPSVQNTQDVQGVYRINLKLEGKYKEFLAEEAWKRRISVTALLNQIIGEFQERCGE